MKWYITRLHWEGEAILKKKRENIESVHYLVYFKHISQALEASFLEPLGLKIEPQCVQKRYLKKCRGKRPKSSENEVQRLPK